MLLSAPLLVLTAAGMTRAHVGRVPLAVLGLIGNGCHIAAIAPRRRLTNQGSSV
jgi:hypothetical protein